MMTQAIQIGIMHKVSWNLYVYYNNYVNGRSVGVYYIIQTIYTSSTPLTTPFGHGSGHFYLYFTYFEGGSSSLDG